mgnify:FL=1
MPDISMMINKVHPQAHTGTEGRGIQDGKMTSITITTTMIDTYISPYIQPSGTLGQVKKVKHLGRLFIMDQGGSASQLWGLYTNKGIS